MKSDKQRFTTQVDRLILEEIRNIAREEGRSLQSLVEDALIDLIAKKRPANPRPEVMDLYEASVAQYDELLKRLAK